MASGFGAFGGVGRCYEIWSDLVKCQQRTPISLECIDFRDDYIECLHGKKEVCLIFIFVPNDYIY